MTRRRAYLLLFLLVLPGAGCSRGAGEAPMARERFVRTNVDLRSLDSTVADSAARRAAILRRNGVTEQQLRGFVAAYAARPEELADVWQDIASGLRHADSARVKRDSATDRSRIAPGQIPPAQLPPQR